MQSGIEVEEHALNHREAGFLSGVFEAWASQTMTQADFRGAMELLISRESRLDN
jgi:hypothetical protein